MSTPRRGKRKPVGPVQETLFGTAVPVQQTRTPDRAVTNDPELVASVVRSAMSRGYVLVGPAQRVYLREPGQTQKGARVEPVSAYEQDAVHQLLDSGQLTTGGTHTVRRGRTEGPAHSVLVPKATQAMVTRWSNLRPLHDGGRNHA
jgi:hypothetical protein